MSEGASSRGQALVEFALVLPFLLVFAVGLILIAEVGVARLVLEHAAAEGARTGALTNDDGAIRDAARAALGPLDVEAVEIVISPKEDEPPRSADPRGSLLSVEVAYAVRPAMAPWGLPPLRIAARAIRVVEWTP